MDEKLEEEEELEWELEGECKGEDVQKGNWCYRPLKSLMEAYYYRCFQNALIYKRS